jgi:hypothetical protein
VSITALAALHALGRQGGLDLGAGEQRRLARLADDRHQVRRSPWRRGQRPGSPATMVVLPGTLTQVLSSSCPETTVSATAALVPGGEVPSGLTARRSCWGRRRPEPARNLARTCHRPPEPLDELLAAESPLAVYSSRYLSAYDASCASHNVESSASAPQPWCIAVLGRFRVERRANGDASSVMASAVACLDLGVVWRPRAVYSRGVALVLVGGRVANDYFLVHAFRPLVEALIRTAGRLAPSRGLCRGVGGAA